MLFSSTLGVLLPHAQNIPAPITFSDYAFESHLPPESPKSLEIRKRYEAEHAFHKVWDEPVGH